MPAERRLTQAKGRATPFGISLLPDELLALDTERRRPQHRLTRSGMIRRILRERYGLPPLETTPLPNR